MNKILLFLALLGPNFCKSQTIGLIQHDSSSTDNGYVLFAPIGSNETYLIDKCGYQVHSWHSAFKPGQSVYLLENGMLLHSGNANNSTFTAGGKGGKIELLNWNGSVQFTYTLSNSLTCQHHDIKYLPNGNILAIAWELKTNSEAINAGRNPLFTSLTVWSEKIIEIDPTGQNTANIVWEWHLWDHLIQDFDETKPNYGNVVEHPELVNINFEASANSSDWIHLNAIDYNSELDQILLSSHSFNEIWIIDHSTTTQEAASHTGGNSGKGGDLIYRWGNPQSYNEGLPSDQKLFGQHNAQWIPEGMPFANSILLFNNGLNRPSGNYSTAEIITPPVDGFNYEQSFPYLPGTSTWIYNENNINNYYAQNISGAQMLSNGHVLLCNGPEGLFSEIDNSMQNCWKYINPISNQGALSQGSSPSQNQVFRVAFYPSDFAGLAGQPLIPSSVLEDINSLSELCSINTSQVENSKTHFQIFPIPSHDKLYIELPHSTWLINLYDLFGNLISTQKSSTSNIEINTKEFPTGMYILIATNQEGLSFQKKVIFD